MNSSQKTRQRLDALAKPPGSLGRLEALAVDLARAQDRYPPTVGHPHVVVFAGDHGVTAAHPVSPYPRGVTQAMVHTFASGRAAVTTLARQARATVEVVDVGVDGLGPVSSGEGVRFRAANIASGTADLVAGPAMTAEQARAAMQVGRQVVADAADRGVDVLALGEMGIGNTTPATAVAARLLGRPALELTGPGTGLDSDGVHRKAALIQNALDRHGPDDPQGALADLGGLELAALAGAMLEARDQRIAVLLDGFIVSAAALVATRMEPDVRNALIATTASAEPGHRAVLAALALNSPPLLDWGLRLGEASAACLALPLARSACAIVREMATLDEVLNP